MFSMLRRTPTATLFTVCGIGTIPKFLLANMEKLEENDEKDVVCMAF